MLPKALKSCTKSNKLSNLVTLSTRHILMMVRDAARAICCLLLLNKHSLNAVDNASLDDADLQCDSV